MPALTREVLADQLAARADITMKAARDEVKWFFETITGAITGGDDVRIHGFESFRTTQRAARTARNPRTGATVQVAPRRVVRFTPAGPLTASLKAGGGRATGRRTRAKK
jgi:DNA-binding protein HU-beta